MTLSGVIYCNSSPLPQLKSPTKKALAQAEPPVAPPEVLGRAALATAWQNLAADKRWLSLCCQSSQSLQMSCQRRCGEPERFLLWIASRRPTYVLKKKKKNQRKCWNNGIFITLGWKAFISTPNALTWCSCFKAGADKVTPRMHLPPSCA